MALEPCDVVEATHVVTKGGVTEEIVATYGINPDGRLAPPSQGGFGVITASGKKIDMWHAQKYLRKAEGAEATNMTPAEEGVVDAIGKAFDMATDALIKKAVAEAVTEAVAEAIAANTEACARICDLIAERKQGAWAEECAAAIRAHGKQHMLEQIVWNREFHEHHFKMSAKWIGKCVTYVSRSGHEYKATVTAIPIHPKHGYIDFPTVSLEFRNQRGKLVRKPSVLPHHDNTIRCVWKPMP